MHSQLKRLRKHCANQFAMYLVTFLIKGLVSSKEKLTKFICCHNIMAETLPGAYHSGESNISPFLETVTLEFCHHGDHTDINHKVHKLTTTYF